MLERKHLLVALSRGGWGEATFGVHVANQLRVRGEGAVFITHEKNAALFASGAFECCEVGDHLGTLLLPLIRETARACSAQSIILCDFMTSDGVMREFGIDGREVNQLGIPVVAVDTWGQSGRRDPIDVFFNKHIEVRDWISTLPTLTPCPFLTPSSKVGDCGFLPKPTSLSKAAKRHVRENLGLGTEDVAILFCTASWQQSIYNDIDGERTADRFPSLLAQYFGKLPSNIHLVHVGPSVLTAFHSLGSRYHWLPPLGDRFDQMLGSMDLMLSANFSATTVAKAVSSSIPVLLLQNSCVASSVDQAIAWLDTRITPTVRHWLETSVPIYEFRLWPLGFFDFLGPVVSSNPYGRTVWTREWLDEDEVLGAILALSFRGSERASLQHAQQEYCTTIESLPGAGDALQELLETNVCAA